MGPNVLCVIMTPESTAVELGYFLLRLGQGPQCGAHHADVAHNPLTHGLFEVRYLMACGLNCPQICGQIWPQTWEMACLKGNCGGGGGGRCGWGWGESCCSYWSFPPRCVWHTQKPAKIGTVSKTAWPEDLFKTKFIIIYWKKSMDRAF